MGIHLPQVAAHGHRLSPGEHREHHVVGLVGIGPLGLPHSGSTNQGVGHVVTHVLRVGGDDEEGFAAVEGLDGAVHQHRLEGQAQQGAQAGTDVEHKQGGRGDHHVGHQQGPPHVHAGVLFQDHGHDVGAAGGGVDIEQNGGPQSGEDDGEEELQHQLVGEGAVQRAHPPEDLNQGGGDDGGIHRPEAEALVQHEKAEDQKKHVDDGVVGGGGEGGNQLPQQDGHAGHAPHGEVVGELEKVHPHTHQQGAQVHQQELPDYLFSIHRIPSLCLIIQRWDRTALHTS